MFIEGEIYQIREFIWTYPDWLWSGRESLRNRIIRTYTFTRPFSHIALAAALLLMISIWAWQQHKLTIFAGQQSRLVEGIIMGVDESGQMQRLTKVNPLVTSAIQLEKDLTELIYEPLIRYEQDSSITPVLASSILRIREGAEYEFVLRDNVYWHDGVKFTVDDVEETLELVSKLDTLERTNSSYVQAISQMAWERTGTNSIRICTTTEELQATLTADTAERRCSGVQGEKPILSNFLELVSIKIMPARWISSLNAESIIRSEPQINRVPVGTGAYIFDGTTDRSIFLKRNVNYYGDIPEINILEFKLYATEYEAVEAIENGEIHTLVLTSTEYANQLKTYPQIEIEESPVQVNQYWAVYFNLRKNLEGQPLGPAFFEDVNVRTAIAYAIDKQRVIDVMGELASIAQGAIPESSYFYNPNIARPEFNYNKAKELLDQSGWILNSETGWREKDGVRLSFKLSYADHYDRHNVAASIKQDLKEIGIEVVLDSRSLKELTEQVVSVKTFDTLLYGMNTFVDPDRYELFHSTQQLNLSSYYGTEQTVKIEGRETVRLPRVDKLLEQGRSFDPLDARDSRKEVYDRVQELINADMPLIFLYHPKFAYYVNKRVNNVSLSSSQNLEQRFRSITYWQIR